MSTLYFAYGSNMDERQMASRVPGSTLEDTGLLPNHEFLFSGYSRTWGGAVANVRAKRGSQVFGVVYALPPGDLSLLDRFEGYPTSYQRKTATISCSGGGKVRAALYYKRAQAADGPPSRAYVEQINRALERHDAPYTLSWGRPS